MKTLIYVKHLDCVGEAIETPARRAQERMDRAMAEVKAARAEIRAIERNIKKLWTPEEIKAAKEVK